MLLNWMVRLGHWLPALPPYRVRECVCACVRVSHYQAGSNEVTIKTTVAPLGCCSVHFFRYMRVSSPVVAFLYFFIWLGVGYSLRVNVSPFIIIEWAVGGTRGECRSRVGERERERAPMKRQRPWELGKERRMIQEVTRLLAKKIAIKWKWKALSFFFVSAVKWASCNNWK